MRGRKERVGRDKDGEGEQVGGKKVERNVVQDKERECWRKVVHETKRQAPPS